MVEVRERVELAQSKESDRALQFDKAMREAESAPVSAKPPPALETARSLARLDTEKAAARRTWSAAAPPTLQAEQGRREKDLNPRLDEIAERGRSDREPGSSRRPGPADEPRSFWPRRRRPSARSPTSRPDVALAGDGLQDRARGLSRSTRGRPRSPLDRRHLQARLEDAITAAVAYSPEARGFTGPAELAAALQSFIKSFPDSPRSRAFTDTLHDQPLWDAIGEWDRLTAGWRGGRAAVAPQEAKVRAEQCRQFLVQHPGSPDADRATAYRQAMEAVAHRSRRRRGCAGQAPEAHHRPAG